MLDAVEAYASVVRDALGGRRDERGEPTTALRLAVAGSTQVALDRPALLVAYLREHHRIGHGALTELVGEDREQFALWTRAIEAVRPDVGKGEQAARLQACLGALVGMSIASRQGRRAPIRATSSAAASSPCWRRRPTPASDRQPSPRASGWTPPPSRRQQLLLVGSRAVQGRGLRRRRHRRSRRRGRHLRSGRLRVVRHEGADPGRPVRPDGLPTRRRVRYRHPNGVLAERCARASSCGARPRSPSTAPT